MRSRIRPCLCVAALLALLCASGGCTKNRNLAGSAPPPELPPVTPGGVASAPGDEPPVVKTDQGYSPTSIPGVPQTPTSPFPYKTYIGISN